MISNGKSVAGIDIGSRTTKAVIWDGSAVLGKTLIPTGWSPEKSAQKAFDEVKGTTQIDLVERIVVTGYGRATASFADKAITEITAHARGVSYLLPGTRTLIDIGGQDSKAIMIDEEGLVFDFAMNDRCAAGSGKFLEFLAMTMDLPVADFAELAFASTDPVQISSICTVFAESEVLSLLAEGVRKENIANGVHRSIAQRVAQMAKSLHPQAPGAFSGGVARNRCMVRELSAVLGFEMQVPEMPEYAGALGAAIIALEGIV
ncbi:2-hydroxyglutaryl-CoA dehydratase [bacterium]|nr:2-hydroxyglutaryl-CoA dehydratase [bacterium]MBU1651181.1 2-hydroxyglutaryl-CoA dehydratase [bacterium]MBU1882153.1 2-hydroxyglutaryl-CoA dehydratase [bacterium]